MYCSSINEAKDVLEARCGDTVLNVVSLTIYLMGFTGSVHLVYDNGVGVSCDPANHIYLESSISFPLDFLCDLTYLSTVR